MVTCRCAQLNVLSGSLADEYARGHLMEERSEPTGMAVYRCPETSILWVGGRANGTYGVDTRLILRRRDV